MTDLKNINDAIMSLNENDLLDVILYRNKNFNKNIMTDNDYYIYLWKVWSTSFLIIIETILIFHPYRF